MKLYYAPGACSQAPHIVLREAGLPFDLVKTDIRAKRTEDGRDYREVNPKGAVPALELEDSAVLTENAAILQYAADLAPASGLLPPLGDFDRYRVIEWLNYVATEMHKGFGPLWNPTSSEEVRETTRTVLGAKFDYLQQRIGDGPYLLGERFTLPDAICSWCSTGPASTRSTCRAGRASRPSCAAWPSARPCRRRCGPKGWRSRPALARARP